MKELAEDQGQIKADQVSITSLPSRGGSHHNRHMQSKAARHHETTGTTPRRDRGRRLATVVAGALLGAGAGTALGGAALAAPTRPSATTSEGAGYGGTASSLHLTVQGEQLVVSGMGFAAGAAVEVRAGEFSTVVTADEFGEVHAVLSGSVDTAAGSIVATGTGSDGLPLTLGEPTANGGTGASGATLGALAGMGGAFLVGRRRKAVL